MHTTLCIHHLGTQRDLRLVNASINEAHSTNTQQATTLTQLLNTTRATNGMYYLYFTLLYNRDRSS